MSRKQTSRRKPSGLCRWRHHDLCTLNSVAMLNGELLQHVVDLECAINRESSIICSAHVYHLDQVIKELWLLRDRMASRAKRNGSPVDNKLSMMFPSMMALLDDAVKVRRGCTSE